MCIPIGAVVKPTTYNAGPFKIIRIFGPSTAPRGLDSINMKNPPPSDPHYNFVCKAGPGSPAHYDKGNFYLNGYNLIDGKVKSVWCQDELQVLSYPPGYQFDLFN